MSQQRLFAQPTEIKITVDLVHELVLMEKQTDWDKLTEIAMDHRKKSVIRISGPAPEYRVLLGAVVLMAVKNIDYRQAQDLITYYVPARYLCNLMESDWNPDHVTIFEFTQMLGKSGMEKINALILKEAVTSKLANPKSLMSDTTAQEAMIPYPNEVGLMSRFVQIVEKEVKSAGKKFTDVKEKIKKVKDKVKGLVRCSHLFAKTKEAKKKVAKKLFHTVTEIQNQLGEALEGMKKAKNKSQAELKRLHGIMSTLLPQIKHFIKTGFVASKKIIHLKMTELYSITRGKLGKSVEFGIKWGVNRIQGGFISGFLIDGGKHVSDTAFCMEALRVHKALHGKAPKEYGYDRGGYSTMNIKKAKQMGVKHVGIAPKGKAHWSVSEKRQEKIKKKRVTIEGCIGVIKRRYGFNKPNVHSTEAMIRSGYRAFIGFNMMKLVRLEMEKQAA